VLVGVHGGGHALESLNPPLDLRQEPFLDTVEVAVAQAVD
jgi:hypothetical protein